MQYQYLVIPAKDLNLNTVKAILAEGWEVNAPGLIVLSRPVPQAPPPAAETAPAEPAPAPADEPSTEILDAADAPVHQS